MPDMMLMSLSSFTVRPLSLFYKLFLIDPVARKAVQLCPFVNSGIMHREFQKFLQPNGLGIDYSHLQTFDTAEVLLADAKRKQPKVIQALRNAMASRDKANLDWAIFSARQINFESLNPELFAEAEQLLSTL